MYGRNAMILPIIVVAILALISFWIESKVKAPLHKSKASLRHDPDYYLENFVTTKTDVQGNLKSMLAATSMHHYPDDDSTFLTRPRFSQFTNNKLYTQIEGQKGQISSNGEVVEFTNRVIVYRPAIADRPDMRLSTDYLKIFSKQEIASTNSPVVITQGPKTVIRGTGMIYDKKQQTVTLLKKVKVHYEKPLPKKTPAVTSKQLKAEAKPNAKPNTKPTKPQSVKPSKITAKETKKKR
jgi:lipopolysaccharide export system protein LptC